MNSDKVNLETLMYMFNEVVDDSPASKTKQFKELVKEMLK